MSKAGSPQDISNRSGNSFASHRSKRSSRILSSTRELGKKTAVLGNRASFALSMISQRFVTGMKETEQLKQSRLTFTSYSRGCPSEDETVFNEIGYVRVIKPMEDQQLTRRLKFKGKIVIGDGRVFVDLTYSGVLPKDNPPPKQVQWSFDIGLIKNIRLKSKKSKECYISFLNNNIVINFLLKTPKRIQILLQRIFFEARVQAKTFHKILNKEINEGWYKLLKIGIFDDIEHEVTLSNSERASLAMTEAALDLIETCLRTEADYWRIAHGINHDEVYASFERLSIFLKNTIRKDEGDFWFDEYKNSKREYDEKLKNQMLHSKVIEDMVEYLRNPPALEAQHVLLENKKLMDNIEYDKRIDAILNTIDQQQRGIYESVSNDVFDIYFPAPKEVPGQLINTTSSQQRSNKKDDISKIV